MSNKSAILSVDEPSSKRLLTATAPSSSLLDIHFKGYPLFLLLELLPRIPQLDDVELLRSVYRSDPAVEEGWSDWFHKVLDMASNEDRCKIFEATFRTFPELATRRIGYVEITCLSVILSSWPYNRVIPINLLDRLLTANPQDLPAVSFTVLIRFGNKDEVALWAIQHKILDKDLNSAIRNSYSLEVVIACAEAIVKDAKCLGRDTIPEALGQALRAGGPYLNKELLWLLWKNSPFEIDFSDGVHIPNWFSKVIIEDAATETEINLTRPGLYIDLPYTLVGTLRSMQRSTSLTKWILSSTDNNDEFVDLVHHVLRDCVSLRQFYFYGRVYMPFQVRIPFMPRLDELCIHDALLAQPSLEPMMSTARVIEISRCLIEFPSEATSDPPDYFEGWARGLEQNSRIESLIIKKPLASGDYRIGGRAFTRAIHSRPKLRNFFLDWRDAEYILFQYEGDVELICLEMDTGDMVQFGMMDTLERLSVHPCRGALKSLLEQRPINLRYVRWFSGPSFTSEDFLAFLDFLELPECQLEEFRSCADFADAWPNSLEGDDERLKFPIRSLMDVLRDYNSTLKTCLFLKEISSKERAEMDFWCRMNKTCPNRLELRRQLSETYGDQLAKYTNGGSYSEAFELIRSTFHLWGRM